MTIPNDVENMIREFENRDSDVAFAKIDRQEVAAQLRHRLKDPSKIDQGAGGLCGPAVFMYCLADRKKKQYVQYVIDLYEKGAASIGRLKVEPGGDCKAFDAKLYKGTDNAIPEVDWIALAGLRDSENNFWDFDDPDDQFAGITLPGEVAEWFAFSDFAAIRRDTNIVFDESLYTLLQAHKLHLSGARVCLFVGANILRGVSGGKAPADHWVVLNSPIKIDGKPANALLAKGKKVNEDKTLLSKKIEFSIYTWVDNNYPVNKNDPNLTVGKFLDYFYGYVSAR